MREGGQKGGGSEEKREGEREVESEGDREKEYKRKRTRKRQKATEREWVGLCGARGEGGRRDGRREGGRKERDRQRPLQITSAFNYKTQCHICRCHVYQLMQFQWSMRCLTRSLALLVQKVLAYWYSSTTTDT